MSSAEDLDRALGLSGLPPLQPVSLTDPIDVRAERLLQLRALRDRLDTEIEGIEDYIASMTPEEPDTEAFVHGKQYCMSVSRSETWSWDNKKVADKVGGTTEVNDFIKVKYTVDKKKFQHQDAATQSCFMDALTRKPGSPKVNVHKNA